MTQATDSKPAAHTLTGFLLTLRDAGRQLSDAGIAPREQWAAFRRIVAANQP